MSLLSEQIELVRNTLIQGSKFTRFHKFDPLGAFDEIINNLAPEEIHYEPESKPIELKSD